MMDINRCRLCFEEKVRPIGIFSAQGVEQHIAELIRAHFSDEVSENDHLPKSICVNCWTTVKNFHELYIAVDHAKHIYLTHFVKTEAPKFIEINCDAVESDEDAPTIKDEVVDHVLTKEDSPLPDSEDGQRDQLRHESNNYFETNDCNDSQIDDTESDDKLDIGLIMTRGRWAKSVELVDVYATKANAISAADVMENDGSGQQVSNYMDMNCELCNIPLETFPIAISHYRSKHRKHAIYFHCCQRRLLPSDIRDHLRYHSNPDIFKCEKCSKRFIERKQLKAHRVVHWPKKFECDICKKKFLFHNNIRTHMISTHIKAQKCFECQICEKRFVTEGRLNSHVRIVHERQGQQVCHICAKVYNSLISLKSHLKDHSDVEEPRADCKICGKWYKNELYVRRHMRSAHQNMAENLQCPKCSKTSPTRAALTKHIRNVHYYKAHLCQLCGKEFKQELSLKEHMAIHTGIDLYTCDYCPKMFKAHANKYKHHKQVHPNEWNSDRKT